MDSSNEEYDYGIVYDFMYEFIEDEDDCEIDEDDENEEIATMMIIIEEVEKEEHASTSGDR